MNRSLAAALPQALAIVLVGGTRIEMGPRALAEYHSHDAGTLYLAQAEHYTPDRKPVGKRRLLIALESIVMVEVATDGPADPVI